MNFQSLQNEVGSQTRFDPTVSANLTLIKRWINRAQQHISATHDWSFLQTREIVQTVVDKTAGTVSVSAGGVVVTGVSTSFASTDVGSFIQFSSSNDWYRITTYSSATSITIESPYVGTTNLSAGTYTIRRFFYALSSAVDRIVTVKQAVTPVKLYPMSPITLDRWSPFHSITGNPYLYACWAYDPIYTAGTLDAINVGNWVIQFYPWPSSVQNIEVSYYRVAPDLSANGDTGVLPQKMRDTVLIDGAIAYGYQYLNDPRYEQMWNKFEQSIERYWVQDGQNRAEMAVMEAVDSTTQDPDIIRLPSSYPFLDGY